jgi:hypothetical protein
VVVLTARGGGPRLILHRSASVLPTEPCEQGQGQGSRVKGQGPRAVAAGAPLWASSQATSLSRRRRGRDIGDAQQQRSKGPATWCRAASVKAAVSPCLCDAPVWAASALGRGLQAGCRAMVGGGGGRAGVHARSRPG